VLFAKSRKAHPETENNAVSRIGNIVGRNSYISWGDLRYTDYLVGTREKVGKKAAQKMDMLGFLPCSNSGLSFRNVRNLRAPHPPYHVLRVSHPELLFPKPLPEAVIFTVCLPIQTKAHYYVGNRQIH
jgi:hypothetical protein